ncbi:hypothetical protein ACFQY5_12115 [Paeniroseomonas aquatica]|uniref:Lipoprotein n=1 Tax=Paeniroseomonas aquatica TaxID=373043 RepID=A0ABT8A8U1_9PROT|nr:hypothetical protein [Paeniroseomonas aquatica]MDN3566222.1 hypothetical protein [Paeniroseomonas aquatica]
MAPRLPLLLLTLGACATAAEERATALRLAFDSSRASLGLPAAAVPAPPAAARLVGTSAGLAEPRSPPPATAAPAAAAQLLGVEPEALRRWLGEPSLRRREGGAEVWLYAGAACALDLVLYPQAGRLRVAHAGARASGAEPRTEAHCLQELAATPAARPMPTGDRDS